MEIQSDRRDVNWTDLKAPWDEIDIYHDNDNKTAIWKADMRKGDIANP